MTIGLAIPHIVVIDDNPADINLVELGYAELGIPIRLSRAPGGAIGMHLLETLRADRACPDLILFDLNMPRMSGFEVIEFIRGRGLCPRSRIVVMTSSTGPDDREWVLALGAERFVSKPPAFDELLVLLKELAPPPAASSPRT